LTSVHFIRIIIHGSYIQLLQTGNIVMSRNLVLSQNARAVLAATVGSLRPVEVPLSSLTEDRMPLSNIIERLQKRGCVPFAHARLEELIAHYECGTLPPPGIGNWIFVTDDWANGVFNLEFQLPPPVPQLPALVSIGFNNEVSLPYGRKHNFVFNHAS
jgi:hypothetical protein